MRRLDSTGHINADIFSSSVRLEARLATHDDVHRIVSDLLIPIGPAPTSYCGTLNALGSHDSCLTSIAIMVENNLAFLVLEDLSSSTLVACAAFQDYPVCDISIFSKDTIILNWQRWMLLDDRGSSSSSWLTFCISTNSQHSLKLFNKMFQLFGYLKRIFCLFSEKQKSSMHMCLCTPLSHKFTPEANPLIAFHTLSVCDRSKIVPPLYVREARVEDQDDLLKVFDESELGDFFLAEHIAKQDHKNKTLAAEIGGRAVGMISITTDVDLDILAQCFDIKPFDYFLKKECNFIIEDNLNPASKSSSNVEETSYAVALLENLDQSLNLKQIFESHSLDERISLDDLRDSLFPNSPLNLSDWPNCDLYCLIQQSHNTKDRVPSSDQDIDSYCWSDLKRSVELLKKMCEWSQRKIIAAKILQNWKEIERQEINTETPGEKLSFNGFCERVKHIELLNLSNDETCCLSLVFHWYADLNTIEGVYDLKEFYDALLVLEKAPFSKHNSSLNEVPDEFKSAICINLFSIDDKYSEQSIEFIPLIFEQFPSKDYCLITQACEAPLFPLLLLFEPVKQLPSSPLPQCLFFVSRGIIAGPPKIRSLNTAEDFQAVISLADCLPADHQKKIAALCKNFPQDAEKSTESNESLLVGEVNQQIVCILNVERVPLTTVYSYRQHYNMDCFIEAHLHSQQKKSVQFQEVQDYSSFAVLRCFVVNPIFQCFNRCIIRKGMNLFGATVLLIEMAQGCLIPSCFENFTFLRPRTHPGMFPSLDLPDISLNPIGLSVTSNRLLAVSKQRVTARIVVVGASDTGLSFLRTILSNPQIIFLNLTLVSPNGLPPIQSLRTSGNEEINKKESPLLADIASLAQVVDLRSEMFPIRVKVISSRMLSLQREKKEIYLDGGFAVPYDYLILTPGLQDNGLHTLQISSWGLKDIAEGFRFVNGCISCADPNIYNLLNPQGTLIKSLVWNPLTFVIVYGRSLDSYSILQGLLKRGIPASKIIHVLPPSVEAEDNADASLVNEAFIEDDKDLVATVHEILKSNGVMQLTDYLLVRVHFIKTS
eukprot:GHVL01044515.1.p1 GENE.GHVL01044515.1~~GHVL01044515.1.p1  ORF type:complete len:1052 (-),score=121.48 GHVL01044515.1:1265-4420(-)